MLPSLYKIEMKFKYVRYDQSLIKNLEQNSKIIYVFSDYFLKNAQKKEINKNIFNSEPLYLTVEEFKNLIFKTNRIVLSESKRFLTFYNLLKNELKKININNYFESIDFANNFFKYYSELNKSLCENKLILNENQKKYFKKLGEFKEKYDDYLAEKNFIPKEWIESLENLDFSSIKNFERIVFIDVVHFSQLDKKVLYELEKVFEVTIEIQGNEKIFDEDELELKDISLNSIQKVNVNLLKVSDEIELASNLIYLMKNKKTLINIFSPEANTNEYFKIFPNNFKRNKFSTLADTKFYKFLKNQLELISSIEKRTEDKFIPIKNFLKVILTLEFQEYYQLEKDDIEYLYKKINDDYKYIKNEANCKIENIYEDIITLSSANDFDYFIDYFNKLLSNPIFKEDIYLNFYDKLQEYIGYAKITLEFLTNSEIKNCFPNNGDILKFILSYFDGVEIFTNEKDENKYLIKSLENCKAITSDESIFINLSTNYLPRQNKDFLFLTEKQKKENGFNFYEKDRRIEKYRLYQALLKNKNITIISVVNQNTNIGVASIVVEFLNLCEITDLKKIIYSDDILNKLSEFKSNTLPEFINSELEKNMNDFKDNSLYIGAYDYNHLNNCEYRFYLEKIEKLFAFEIEESIGIGHKFLGTYIHDIFEKITYDLWKNILKFKNYKVDYNEVVTLLRNSFNINRKKIPLELDNYFLNILIPRFAKNIVNFYKEIETLYSDKTLTRIESEKRGNLTTFVTEKGIDIFLTGKADLVIETQTEKHIIDFKSGTKPSSSDKNNKNNKIEQLDFYSIMFYGSEETVKKSLYYVFSGELDNIFKKSTEKSAEETLKNNILQFLKEDSYSIMKNKNSCEYCSYDKLCRKGEL